MRKAALLLAALGGVILAIHCGSPDPDGGGEGGLDAASDAWVAETDAGHAVDTGAVMDSGGGTDTGNPDTGGEEDAGGEMDAAGDQDIGATDTGTTDAGTMDAGGVTDAGVPDASAGDAGVYRASGDPYAAGPLAVKTISVTKGQSGAPVAMEVHAPTAAGRYAVVVFQHGFLLSGKWYGAVLDHLAGHGFVVVAPQMYNADGLPFGKPKAVDEAASAVKVYDWLATSLPAIAGVEAVTAVTGLAGHSRGGKVVWIVLKGDPTRAKAVAGIDPVDGTGGPLGGEERVIAGSFSFPFPTYVLGTGLGPTGAQPCAPAGDNHVQFYSASASPAWHAVATEYGHMDMLDDATTCGLTCSVCPKGSDKPAMRALVGGHLAAFFRAALQGDAGSFDALTDTAGAPVKATAEKK